MNAAPSDTPVRAVEPQAMTIWNAHFPVGIQVIALRADGHRIRTHTVSKSFMDARGRARILCAAMPEALLLSNVEAMQEAH